MQELLLQLFLNLVQIGECELLFLAGIAELLLEILL